MSAPAKQKGVSDMHTIGFVWPGPVEPGEIEETSRFLPPDVTVRYVQTSESETESPDPITLERLLEMADSPDIAEAAEVFGSPEIDAVGYACTSASYVRGVGGDIEIVDRIAAATGLPTTTTSTAVVKALQAVGARRVSVLSPHVDELNERLRLFLEGSGFEVAQMRGLNRLRGIEQIPPDEIAELVVHLVDRPDADCIFISCTGMKTSTIIDSLEERTSKPVVSALQATVWGSLRLAGAPSTVPSVGQLFRPPVSV